jgi:hypothetical protein
MLSRIRARALVAAVLLAGSLHAQTVRADVRVSGPPEAIRLEVHDAPVQEVLAALNASFGLRYRGAAALDRRISGTYHGALPRVVRRLLDGYDFIVVTDADTVEVVVIGVPGEARIVASPVSAPVTIPSDPTPQRRRRSNRSAPH